ncbi:diacylglycerol/lipid kinase family protein [Liquorilactobacillus satsumensis]|nr:diacylglycerol kinase family protein [Liquorilactobacillus satsumensis]MCP9313536.1 diacylglycerol kinase [Liquorilactobacillus satsumensis]MCP9360698.1 diacylglycerol kinase [Liquorilactobacillus satsumensis]
MEKKTLLFFNSNAGDGQAQQIAVEMQQKLEQKGAQIIELNTKTRAEAIVGLQEMLRQKQLAKIVCIGGDGTLNIVATALVHAHAQVPVGLIPAGTVNNFAQKWQIPLEPRAAIDLILRGNQRRVDIGECNGTAIVSSLLFGSLAELSNDVQQRQKQKFGLAVYGWSALKHLGKRQSAELLFFNQTFSLRAKVWVCLMTTSNYVGGYQYLGKTSAGLHVTMLNNMKINKLLNYGFFALTGNLRRSSTLTSFDIKEVIIKPVAKQAVSVRIDGDEGPQLPAKISWLPHFMTIYVK